MSKIEVPCIKNSKIVKVRKMTEAELKAEDWENPTFVLELDTGVKLYASGDDEGNYSWKIKKTLLGKIKNGRRN